MRMKRIDERNRKEKRDREIGKGKRREIRKGKRREIGKGKRREERKLGKDIELDGFWILIIILEKSGYNLTIPKSMQKYK